MTPEHINITDTSLFDPGKKIMCIKYPGMVKDINNMLHTLGGLDNIGVAYGTKNRRMELRFRPNDIYAKPACGERYNTSGLILKVRIKCTRQNPDVPCSSKSADVPQAVSYTATVVGLVDTIFKFKNLCDFQYLPMHTNEDGKCENIHDKLYPPTLPDSSWLKEENIPLFLTPQLFSRFDTVHFYNTQQEKEDEGEPNLIGRTRRRRTGHTVFANFKDEKVPQKPSSDCMKVLNTKHVNPAHFETLKKMFEERPVWSKTALLYQTKFSKDHMKILLPLVAYHFTTGPWRVMWVRYGYDPRTDPGAVIYQTLDYRLRTADGLNNIVKAKRSYSNYLLPYKSAPSSRPKVAVIDRHSMARARQAFQESMQPNMIHEDSFTFRPGMVPPSRQMFYQYCDVQVPEIQSMIMRLHTETLGNLCNFRTGWLPDYFDARCREIVSNLVSAELRKQMNSEKQKPETCREAPEERDMEDAESDDPDFSPESDIDIQDIMDSDLEDSLLS